MFSTTRYTSVIKNLRQSLRYINDGSADFSDITRWFDIASAAIDALRNDIDNLSLNSAKSHKAQNFLAHLLTIKSKLTGKQGAGLQGENDIAKVEWKELNSAFQTRIKSGIIINKNHIDILSFLSEASTIFKEQIKRSLHDHNALKVNTELATEYIITKGDGEEVESIKYFNTKSHAIFKTTELDKWFKENVTDRITRDMEEFNEQGSGWTLKSILHLMVNINKFNPMRGSSFIKTPPFIAKKRAILNVKNKDQECFKWAILSALLNFDRKDHPNRVSKYFEFQNRLNFANISFPVVPNQISKFEKQNDVSVNLYMLVKKGEKYDVRPYHLTEDKKKKHVNLLILENYYIDEDALDDFELNEQTDENAEERNFHYVWIKELSRLVSSQVSSRNKKLYLCDRCLHFFISKDRLTEHERGCNRFNKCKIVLPTEKDNILEFRNFRYKEKVPFTIYGDFESILTPTNDETSKAYNLHEAFSIGMYVKCNFDDTLSHYVQYRKRSETDQEPAQWFADRLLELSRKFKPLYDNEVKMNKLTPLEENEFKNAKVCHICEREIAKELKHRDHCHFTGR